MKAKRKAPAKKKPAARKSTAASRGNTAKTSRATAPKKVATYEPQPIEGTGSAPFRYPPI